MSTLTDTSTAPSTHRHHQHPAPTSGGLGAAQLMAALPGALRKLDPRLMWRNPVMFIVEVGAALTTVLAIAEPFLGGPAESGGSAVSGSFTVGIAVWLWLTVIFANLAESVAEGRGKAQADSLRQTRTSTTAHRVARLRRRRRSRRRARGTVPSRRPSCSSATSWSSTAGELIPGDGDIVWGIASRRRIGDHRRIRPRRAGVRRRPQRGHRRHPGALRPHRRADHEQAGRDLRRPHDRASSRARRGRRRRTRSR